jgi:type II secretory pathway component GspD/PulD (secretin)
MKRISIKQTIVTALLAACCGAVAAATQANVPAAPADNGLSTFIFRDTPIAELFEMIARHERINIMLGKGVTGNVAVSLYDMTPRQAIYAIAEAGGYKVLERDNGYLIVNPAQAQDSASSAPAQLEVRALKVLYSDPQIVAGILAKHVGSGGKVTVMPGRSMVVVEDTPEGMPRMVALLREIDSRPKQIMIEAKILEITLDNDESFGVDWNKIISADGVNRFGTKGLSTPTSPGLFFNFVNKNVTAYLNALSTKDRVHTLATPKLLTLENQEATTNIGDNLGYRLTTTINNVTSESIQFLETGVILRVIPNVDGDGKISLRVRPEVSSGSVLGGIPSKKTTQVTTQMVAEDGQTILIAGLIKTSASKTRTGIPLLGDVPGLGRLFSSTDMTGNSTETIILITPKIVDTHATGEDARTVERVEQTRQGLEKVFAAPARMR